MKKKKLNKKNYFKELYLEWDKLVSTKNNISKKHPCPVCKSKKNNIIFIKKKLNFCICPKCNHIFINPYFKKKIIQRHFQISKSWSVWSNKILFLSSQVKLEREKYNSGINLIKKKTKKKLKILDIGCSSGFFLKICKRLGWDAEGIEPSKNACSYGKKKWNLKIYNTNFENFYSDKKYDLITMWASFEYLENLNSDIKKIRYMLKRNGLVLIYTSGNSNSLIMRLLKEKCIGYVFNRRNYFNPKSLNYLMRSNKFKLIASQSHLAEIDNIDHFSKYQDPYLNKKNKNFTFLGKIMSERKILKNLMGYKFLSLYEKN